MRCDEARLFIEADPESASPELQAHLQSCPECQAHRQHMAAFNARIRRALEIDVGAIGFPRTAVGTPDSAPPASEPVQRASASAATEDNVVVLPKPEEEPVRRAARPRWLAMAASVAAGGLIALTLWLSRPTQTLAAEVVTHVEGEPGSWSQTEPVDAGKLEAVLRKSGVKLGARANPVVYASACWFRGHYVPHFVVMTSSGPVTVMILVHEPVASSEHFNEAGYSGMLVPADGGSIAVVSRGATPLEEPARDMIAALQHN